MTIELFGSNSMAMLEWAESRLRRAAGEMAHADCVITAISNSQQDLAVKAGFVAEEMHAVSFNLDGILKDIGGAARTDRHACFFEFGYRTNCSADIVVANGRRTVLAQVKYYKGPHKTAAALREIRYGVHVYAGMQLVVPYEQLTDVQKAAHRTKLKELAAGRRPLVAAAAEEVMTMATDRIELDGIQSAPVSFDYARNVASGPNREALGEYLEPYIIPVIAAALNQRAAAMAPLFDFSTLFINNNHGIGNEIETSETLAAKERIMQYFSRLGKEIHRQMTQVTQVEVPF